MYRIAREASPPFIAASAGGEPLCAVADSYTLSAMALEGKQFMHISANDVFPALHGVR